MLSDRSGRDRQFRDRRCDSRCGSDDGRIGYSREGRHRLSDQPMMYRRQGSMGNTLVDGGLAGDLGGGLGGGLGSSRLGGGLGGGLPRSPMMGRGLYGSRGSSSLDPRMPYMEEDLGGRRGSLLRNGLGVPSVGSREQLVGGRAAMMGAGMGGGMRGALGGGLGGAAMGGRLAAGIGSPLGSPAGSIYDPYRMDRPRMPYGPAAQAGMGNYRSPYVEDYESEMEAQAEMMDRAMMERELIGPGDGYYGYGAGNQMGGQYMYQ